MTKTYDIIYSFGTDCTCARYMLKYHLRSFAGPFDWIGLAEYPVYIRLIEDDFSGFMEFDKMQFIPRRPEIDYLNPKIIDFIDTGTGYHFYHDFPKGQTLEESYPDVKAKYDRRINRFINQLKTAKHPLLIRLSHYDKLDRQTILDSTRAIMKKFDREIDFIFIENDETKAPGEIERIDIAPNIVQYKILTKDPEIGGKIPLTALGCDKIFSQIRCKGQIKRRLHHWLGNIAIRFLCLFIPYRPWRKALKHRQKL